MILATARRGVRLAVLALLLVGLYLVVTFAQVWAASERDEARPVDAIVVLGAAQYGGTPSPVFQRRLDHAVALWREGLAPRIVVTGGRQPGDAFTEAAAAAGYLIGQGVPEDQLLLESDGATSWESLAAADRILDQRGIERVLLVSDPYHALRIAAIADELGLQASVSPTDGGSSLRSLARESVIVAVGRVVGFGRLERLDERVGGVRTLLPRPLASTTARSGVV